MSQSTKTSVSSDSVNCFPVAGWNIGAVNDVVFFNPQYLIDENDTPEKCQKGKYYAFSALQALELMEALDRSLKEVLKNQLNEENSIQ